MKLALLLIDIQNDYFPGGRMELKAPLLAAQQAGRLLDFFRRQSWPTVHIQHVSNRPGATFSCQIRTAWISMRPSDRWPAKR